MKKLKLRLYEPLDRNTNKNIQQMEITNGNIIKAMMPYLGYKTILKSSATGENLPLTLQRIAHAFEFELWSQIKVIIKPLSDISDEDLMDLAKLKGLCNIESLKATNDGYWVYHIKGYNNFYYWSDLEGVDVEFIRSRGYDYKSYYLNGQTLQEAGLATYENKS